MFAWLESASIDWAREMRGIASMAIAVTPAEARVRTPSELVSGSRKPMRVAPCPSLATSSGLVYSGHCPCRLLVSQPGCRYQAFAWAQRLRRFSGWVQHGDAVGGWRRADVDAACRWAALDLLQRRVLPDHAPRADEDAQHV